ncbi:glycosyltransferase [Zavarzinella formosa]|uniref:glycosyltransferase n=1 Tax=Zavarzinella formosa TaxID=360055 RepID=UPI0002D9951E|nr:glycosyltransferase [Zavarzinella formosa]
MVPTSFTRKFLIVLAFVVCIFYLAFRLLFTINMSGPYAITASVLLYVAELFGIFNLFLFFLQVWEVSEPPAQPVLEGRTVDVLIPTYNEDVSLLRATLEACVRMDYPHKTYVLDDGQRPEVEALARELGILYIKRPDNRHFKAGNLNNAFERTDGEFVVILDADHVPEPHFITRLIGYFRDERLGFVQTPHAFYNFDSFQARLDHKNRKYWEEGHLFYYVIQPGRNHWECPIFAGSAAMFRRGALRDIGLIATETITEDLHTGLRMNAKKWRSVAITERLVAGQAAPDITTFHAQRLRWGTGNLSIMKFDNPIFTKGLTFTQRLCYLGSMLHWASGLFKLIIYITPIAMLFSGVPPVREFTRELLIITLVYLLVSLTTMKIVSNGYGSIINSELFAMVNFWTQMKSTFRAIFGIGSRNFGVTAKGAAAVRQRQQKSVWPFIRPQTYLIILSVLALFWGWSRPILGISDDWFKPVVPTIWVLIHFWLAYKVTQRAFWPADRRLTTRHVVHVPVEYETALGSSAPPRYGVTVDLNDTGMAFVAYEKFNAGDILRVIIRGAGEVIKCKGEIRTVNELTRGSQAEGVRYGVQFLNLTSPQVDALNRLCLHYGVPRMYSEYEKNRGGVFGAFTRWQGRGLAQRRIEHRNQYHMPIIVNSGVTEDTAQFSTTEDLTRTAVAVMLEHDIPKNTQIGYLMSTPMGDIRGTARVMRTNPEQYGGKTYHRCVLEFNDFEAQGRTTLNIIVNPNDARPMTQALKPDRRPILVKMAGPTLVAVLIAIPLILAQSGIFQFYHKDDYILRNISKKNKDQLTATDETEVKRIFESTMKDSNPTTDRLVLLMNALKVYNLKQDQLSVAERLATRNTSDLTLQQSLIYAQMHANRYEDAKLTYETLMEKANKLRPEDRLALKLSGARVAEGEGNLKTAVERYKELYADNPDYFLERGQAGAVPLRREYAGVLIKANQYEDAKVVLESAPPEDIEARKMLVASYLLQGRRYAADESLPEATRNDKSASEYAKADEQVTKLQNFTVSRPGQSLSEAERASLSDTAEKMRADVFMAKQSYTNAEAIIRKMATLSNADPAFADPDLQRRLYQAQLGNKDNIGAMTGFQSLLQRKDLPDAVKLDAQRGFLDASSDVSVQVDEKTKQTAIEIYNEWSAKPIDDAVYLARLGWVLQRSKEFDKATRALELAKDKEPKNLDIRKQYANILLASGNLDLAADALKGINEFKAQETMASQYFKRDDLSKVVLVLRSILNNYKVGDPNKDGTKVTADDMRRVELIMGKALTLVALRTTPETGPKTAFLPAIEHYEKAVKTYPTDRQFPAFLAHTKLFAADRTKDAKDYADALKGFEEVISKGQWNADPVAARDPANKDVDLAMKSKVEAGFVDAAAGLLGRTPEGTKAQLTPEQVKIAQRLAAERLADKITNVRVDSRLAWVLAKSEDPLAVTQAKELMNRALAAKPVDAEDRKELADTFAAAKEYGKAADLLKDSAKTYEDRKKLFELYAGAREWKQAADEMKLAQALPGIKDADRKEASKNLAKVTAWSGEHKEALALIEKAIAEDPTDTKMKAFKADVTLWSRDYDGAFDLYQNLRRQNPTDLEITKGYLNAAAKTTKPLSEVERQTIMALAESTKSPEADDALLQARLAEVLSVKFEDKLTEKARDLAINAFKKKPKDHIIRKEIGTILASKNIALFKEADDMFAGTELTGDERKTYISIASQAENFEAARRQARMYLAEQVPGTPKEREARRLLADVLTWKGDYEEALAIYERMLAVKNEDKDLRVDLAEVNRFWQNYPVALQLYAKLLTEQFDNEQMWIGFIDAASSAPKIESQKELLLKVYDRYHPALKDARRLSRLAWVMLRLGEAGKANLLLTRAVATNPPQPAVRKELAGVLAAADRRVEAIEMLTPPFVFGTLDIKEILNLTDLLTAESQLKEAEAQLAKVVTDRSDKKYRLRYAEVLLWNNKYAKAQEIFVKLIAEFPEDEMIQLRLAQTYLWSKDYPTALRRYTDLLALRPTATRREDMMANPEVWQGYIDATAGAVGESLREFPRRNIGPLLSTFQRDQVFKAYDYITTVQAKIMGENKTQMDKMLALATDKDPTYEVRRKQLQAKNDVRVKGLAESMGRLGLMLGLLGDRDRSTGAFGAALAIDRTNRDVWLQYAQALTALGDDRRAMTVFDWLLATRDTTLPNPNPVNSNLLTPEAANPSKLR